jgi:hypothetical protein
MNSWGADLPTSSHTWSNALAAHETRIKTLVRSQYRPQMYAWSVTYTDKNGTDWVSIPSDAGTNDGHGQTKCIDDNVIAVVDEEHVN